MKITLDSEVVKGKEDTSLYLLSLLLGCPITVDTFEKAKQQGLIQLTQLYDRRNPMPKYVTLNETGQHVVESILADSKSLSESEDQRYINLANAMREIFPSGKKPGYAYTWRDSTSCIADRLKKFFLKYGDYPDEQVIDATKRYVDSFNGNYQYMQLLKYFIWKNKTTGEEVVRGRIVGEVERQSQLAAWLEDSEEKSITQEWGVALR